MQKNDYTFSTFVGEAACNRAANNQYPALLKYALFALLLVVTATLQAQPSQGGTPLGLSFDFKNNYPNAYPLKTKLLPSFPLEKVLKEDQTNPGQRFAAPLTVDLDLQNAGHWTELADGDRVWQLQIRSEGALGIAALYDEFYLPPGARLFMYSPDGGQIRGAYTPESNTPNGTFLTGFIKGETAVIEYFEPKAVRGQGWLHIFRVDHAYNKTVFTEKRELEQANFGDSQPCNVNVNCTPGINWQKQKRGICRILVVVEQGSGYCTGNLMNNTAEDGKPYILSAFHCQDGFTPKYDFWRYDFNYEAAACLNPTNEPAYQSMLGSSLRASRRQNDFLLLELRDTIPDSYNVYYNGWDRRTQPPVTSFSIHHPQGDIKKISTENQPAVIHPNTYQWSRGDGQVIYTSPPSHLFRVQFDASTVEPGSSGAALFNSNGHVVGQLHGGNDLGSCTLNNAYYDRFSLAWDGGGIRENRLKDWLDPDTSNVTSLDGMEKASANASGIAGFVRTPKGDGIAGVSVSLDGTSKANAVTDSTGAFKFQNLSITGSYNLALEKDFGDVNGVNVVDIVRLSKHILGIELLDDPLKVLAGDVNASKSITVLDIVTLRKLILGIDPEFTAVPSWRFVPAEFTFTDPLNPWDDFISVKFSVPKLSDGILTVNFTGYKLGDVDFSANPRN